ncbi:MAG TPA: hypothetical protein VIM11_28490 [Tepidisphaeraceae bacterium]|jgi:hypothetical protein
MHYTGKLFYPPNARLELDLSNLSPIQGRAAYQLYGQFKREMDNDEFDATVDAGEGVEPIMIRFGRVGQTAGYAAFARGNEETAERLEAVVAFLSRLDPDDDDKVIEQLRANPFLEMIDEADWESAREDEIPLAAAFFTGDESLNDPLIHGLMSLAGAAFFDRLGLLD